MEELALLVRIYQKPEIKKVLSIIHKRGNDHLYNESELAKKNGKVLMGFLAEDVDPSEFLETSINIARVLDKISLTYGVEVEESFEMKARKGLVPGIIEEKMTEDDLEIIGYLGPLSEKEVEEIKRVYDTNRRLLMKFFSAKYQALNKLFGDIYKKLDKVANQEKDYLKK